MTHTILTAFLVALVIGVGWWLGRNIMAVLLAFCVLIGVGFLLMFSIIVWVIAALGEGAYKLGARAR